jgi:hypothetical protein
LITAFLYFHTPGVLDKLKAVSKEILPEYAIDVHGMKGVNANISAEITRKAALNLEKMVKTGDLRRFWLKTTDLLKTPKTLQPIFIHGSKNTIKENPDK